jgi:putative hydrolase of the HAD superfamily
MIRFVVFDLDDTLYNERQFVYSGYRNVANYLGKNHNLDSKELYMNMCDFFKENGRKNLFDFICNKCGINQDIGELVSIYRTTKPQLNLYDDAYKLLADIKGEYKLGIITDGESQVQWNKIRVLGVEQYFDKIIVTDDKGKEFWKPSKKPYIEVINHFGGKPNEFVYIGDNPNKDFISAKKVGMYTIRIIREIGDHMMTFLSKEYEADYNISSLDEVKKVIDIINEKEVVR